MLIATLRGMSPRSRLMLARWTGLGTSGCVAFAVAVNWLLFRELGQPALGRAIFSGTIIPFMLAGPLFFYLTLKLRELAIANHRLSDAASTDSLTRCLNRGAFSAHVDAWLERVSKDASDRAGALLVIDADYFKRINDRFGHGRGDEALRLIAAAIKSTIRGGDLVGRLGGEEFAVFLPGNSDATAAAERIRNAVELAAFKPDGRRCPLTVSIGGAVFEEPLSFSELYREADERLYEAKNSGRNRVVVAHLGATAPAHKTMSLH